MRDLIPTNGVHITEGHYPKGYYVAFYDADGEAEYTIQAVIYDPLDYEPECDCGEDDHSYCEIPSWSDHNGAAHLVDVYLADDTVSDRWDGPEYDSIEACFGDDAKLVKGE